MKDYSGCKDYIEAMIKRLETELLCAADKNSRHNLAAAIVRYQRMLKASM